MAEDNRKKVGKVIARAWLDKDFHARLMKDPHAVLTEAGIHVKGKVHVHQSTRHRSPSRAAEAARRARRARSQAEGKAGNLLPRSAAVLTIAPELCSTGEGAVSRRGPQGRAAALLDVRRGGIRVVRFADWWWGGRVRRSTRAASSPRRAAGERMRDVGDRRSAARPRRRRSVWRSGTRSSRRSNTMVVFAIGRCWDGEPVLSLRPRRTTRVGDRRDDAQSGASVALCAPAPGRRRVSCWSRRGRADESRCTRRAASSWSRVLRRHTPRRRPPSVSARMRRSLRQRSGCCARQISCCRPPTMAKRPRTVTLMHEAGSFTT